MGRRGDEQYIGEAGGREGGKLDPGAVRESICERRTAPAAVPRKRCLAFVFDGRFRWGE